MNDSKFVMKDAEVENTHTVKGKGIEAVRSELDNYYDQMKSFKSYTSDQVILCLSSWTARMSEIKGQLSRSNSAIHKNMITKEIDPFISECGRQFSYYSRLHSIQELEFRLTSQVT